MSTELIDVAVKHNLQATVILSTGGELRLKDIVLNQGWGGTITGTRVHMVADAKGEYKEAVCHGHLYRIPLSAIVCFIIDPKDIPTEEA